MSEESKNHPESKPNPKVVTRSQLSRMKENYQKTSKEDDTKWVWFSASDIMALINDNKATGVRIHYGRHEKDESDYSGRHNVILVATKDTVEGGDPSCLTSVDLLTDHDEEDAGESDKIFRGRGLNQGCLCPPRGNC